MLIMAKILATTKFDTMFDSIQIDGLSDSAYRHYKRLNRKRLKVDEEFPYFELTTNDWCFLLEHALVVNDAVQIPYEMVLAIYALDALPSEIYEFLQERI